MTASQTFRAAVDAVTKAASDWRHHANTDRMDAVRLTLSAPNSFTAAALDAAVDSLMARISQESVLHWVGSPPDGTRRCVAVLNAGNVPLVGLQDFLAVVLLGHRYVGVTSRKSPFLLPAFVETVKRYAPEVAADFTTFDEACTSADTVIATGSSATGQIVSRRFAAAGIPMERQLLRGTRFGAAVLNGSETDKDLYGLARDALLHDGRGCRNVAVILAPAEVDPAGFVEQANSFRRAFPAHPSTLTGLSRVEKFLRAVGEPFVEGDGFMVVEGDVALRESCVLRWIRLREESQAVGWLERNARLVQVVAGNDASRATFGVDACVLGMSQDPPLDWRPDGIDTVSFLQSAAVTGL